MKVEQTNEFARAVKKLNRTRKALVDDAVREILQNPEIGELKTAHLVGIRVHRSKLDRQLTLLGCQIDDQTVTLYL